MSEKENRRDLSNVQVKLPVEAVTAIMNGAFSECSEFICIDEAQIPHGVPAGEWAARRLLDGEAVRFYATETPPGTPDPKCWDVTLEKLRAGVLRYLSAGLWFMLEDDTLDAECLEPEDSIPIIALAVFGPGLGEKEERT